MRSLIVVCVTALVGCSTLQAKVVEEPATEVVESIAYADSTPLEVGKTARHRIYKEFCSVESEDDEFVVYFCAAPGEGE